MFGRRRRRRRRRGKEKKKKRCRTYGTHFGTQCWVEAGNALAADVGTVINTFLVLTTRIRFT